MVEVRIGSNTAAPYEVKVGAMVRLFSDKNDAAYYAFRENNRIVDGLCRQVEEENKIIWPDGF